MPFPPATRFPIGILVPGAAVCFAGGPTSASRDSQPVTVDPVRRSQRWCIENEFRFMMNRWAEPHH